MPLEFRRGKDAIEESKKNSQSGGDFRPFLTNFFWKKDKESKYLWILNPADDIPTVKTISAFTTKGRPEIVVSRQDDAIGRSSDPLEDEKGYGPSDTGVCIAVELEPVNEIDAKGHVRPVGFEVATKGFKHRIRDDDGELTDETVECVRPVVGVICQSTFNFFNVVTFRDTENSPINESPLEITRIGTDTGTTYNIDLFDKPIDMGGLLDNWEDINYLSEGDKDAIADVIDDMDDEDLAILIGNTLLDNWLDEHASQEWYDEVLSIAEMAKYKSARYKREHGEGEESSPKTERPKRASQRRVKKSEDAVAEPEATEPEPEAEEPAAEEAPKRRGGRRKAAATEEQVTKGSPVKARLDKILADQEAVRAKRAKAA